MNPNFLDRLLKKGQAYCYHVKFANGDLDPTHIKFVYSLGTLARAPSTVAFATNSYLQKYTADGVNNSTFVKNSRYDLLHIEYPACPSPNENTCPCRGQFCQVRSFNPLPNASAAIVAASLCVEAPAAAPTKSFIISFGDPTKITDAKNQPISTDNPKILPDASVEAIAMSCKQRGFY